MKHITICILFLMLAVAVSAQPESFKYQTVARDAGGNIVESQPVSFQISIRQGAPDGINIYTETHTTTTNQFGLANLEIGAGTVGAGDFASIDWGSDDYYLEISFDITGGSNYELAGTSQLLAVPYALYAKNSGGNSVWQASDDDIYFDNGNVGIGGIPDPYRKLSVSGGDALIEAPEWCDLSIRTTQPGTDAFLALRTVTDGVWDNDNYWGFYNDVSDANKLSVLYNGAKKLTVAANGNVGIGTSNPGSLLDIHGGTRFTVRLDKDGRSKVGNLYSSDDTLALVSFGNAEISIDDNNNTDDRVFRVVHNGNEELMRLQENGNVGIGTNNPATKLHLHEGDLRITNGQLDFGDHARVLKYTEDGYMSLQSPGFVSIVIDDNNNNNNQAFLIKKDSYDPSAATELFRVQENGRVGIGTSNPASELHVVGKTTTSGLDLNTTGNTTFNVNRGLDQHGGIRFLEEGDDQPQWIFPYFRGWQGENLIIRDEKHYKDVMTFEYGTGMVGIGVSDPESSLDVKGNITVRDASENIILELGSGLDYAEGFNVTDHQNAAPGTVLSIDPDNPGKLVICSKAYDTKVAGIVAGANGLGSGIKLGVDDFDCDVALAGRVYCNVVAGEEGINPGDLLTTSDIPGFAMKVKKDNKANGAILGKAMESLDQGEKGQILVLVTLQ